MYFITNDAKVINNSSHILYFFTNIRITNKSAKWHCGRHTLICKNKTN